MDYSVSFVDVVLLLWLGGLSVGFYSLMKLWRTTFQSELGKDLHQTLRKVFSQSSEVNQLIKQQQKEIIQLQKEQKLFLKKKSFRRFNPYEDTGGDQSFIWAVLDETDNGIVLSSLHGRGGTRVYAKEIKQGAPTSHQLSDEEQLVLKQAINS